MEGVVKYKIVAVVRKIQNILERLHKKDYFDCLKYVGHKNKYIAKVFHIIHVHSTLKWL